MIRSGSNNSAFQSIFLVPAGITIDNEKLYIINKDSENNQRGDADVNMLSIIGIKKVRNHLL